MSVPRPGSVTIADVAREAGVSTATVSNALNATGRASEATRRRVREAAARLGYRPNPAGRALRTGRAGAIGLAVTTYGAVAWDVASVSYYAQAIAAATSVAHQHGYALVLLPAGLDADGWWDVQVDGVVLMDSPEDDPAVAVLRERRIPVAFDGRPDQPHARDSWVDNDHEQAIAMVLDHLAAQGATRVGLLAGDSSDAYTRACVSAYTARVAQPRIGFISHDDPEGRRAARALLEGGADAVHGIFDGCGRGVLAAARELGLRVPDDVLVVTASEDPAYAWTAPPVTTLSLLPVEAATRAVTALVGAIETGEGAAEADLPVRLDVRASTQPLR